MVMMMMMMMMSSFFCLKYLRTGYIEVWQPKAGAASNLRSYHQLSC